MFVKFNLRNLDYTMRFLFKLFIKWYFKRNWEWMYYSNNQLTVYIYNTF